MLFAQLSVLRAFDSFGSSFSDPHFTRLADAEVARQPRYPAFAEQINKALAGFERAREWADLITCLQKLSKALGRSAPPFVAVPSRLLMGRRLAQCLNAALPSGVHLEALETYELLFHRIGVRRCSVNSKRCVRFVSRI